MLHFQNKKFAVALAALAALSGKAWAQDEKELVGFTDGAFQHDSIVGTILHPVLGEVLVTGGSPTGEDRNVVLATPVAGGPSVVLFLGGQGAYPERISNGVLYVGDELADDLSQIVRILPDGTPQPITRGPGRKRFVGEALGGQYFVFTRTDLVEGVEVERLWRTNGTEPASLLLPGRDDVVSVVMADGGALLYYTSTDGRGDAQMFELDLAAGTPPRPLTSTPGYKFIARQMRPLPPGAPIQYLAVDDAIEQFAVRQINPSTSQILDIVRQDTIPIWDHVYDRETNTLYLGQGSSRLCIPLGPGPFDPTPQYGLEDFFDTFYTTVPGLADAFVIGSDLLALTNRMYRVTDSAEPCRADLDGDGELTLFDFLAFQNLFGSGDLRADFDGDGALTLFDFLAFQNEFAIGCP